MPRSGGLTLDDRMRKRIAADFITFGVAAVLFLFLCAVLGITPFGDASFLVYDMKRQYVDFFAYLKSVVFTENDLRYSLSNGLGGEMPGFFAYYLTSPLNVIFLVVPHAYYPEAVTALLCVKTGLTAVTCREFLAWDAECIKYYTIPLAIAYAFSAHFIMNLSNTIWHDAFLWAPVFMMMSLKLVGAAKGTGTMAGSAIVPVPLADFIKCALSAAVLIYLHYYIAYMVLIVTFVWVVVRAVRSGQIMKRIGAWCLSCLLGAALTAGLMLPTALALPDSAKGEGSVLSRIAESVSLIGSEGYSVLELLKRLVPLTFTTDQVYEGTPQVYVGVVVLVLAGGYVVMGLKGDKGDGSECHRIDKNKAESVTEQVTFRTVPFVTNRTRFIEPIILLAFLLLCFLLPPVDLIMHGGSAPWGYRFRYAFMFSFILVVMAHRFVVMILEKCVRGTGTAVTLFPEGDGCSPHDEKCDSVPVPLTHFSGIGQWIKNHSALCLALLTIIIMSDSLANAAIVIRRMSYNMETASHYREWTREMEQALYDAGIENGQYGDSDEVFRMEVLPHLRRSENDASAFAFNGVTHYNSEGNMEQYRFLQSLGMNYDGHFADFDYDNLPAPITAVTGVKYMVAPDEDGGNGMDVMHSLSLYERNDDLSLDLYPFHIPVAMCYPNGRFKPEKNAWEELVDEQVETLDPFLCTSRMLYALYHGVNAPEEEKARQAFTNPTGTTDPKYGYTQVFAYSKIALNPVKLVDDAYVKSFQPYSYYSDHADSVFQNGSAPFMPPYGYFYLAGLKNQNQNMSIYLNDAYRSGYANASATKILLMNSLLPEYEYHASWQKNPNVIAEIRQEIAGETVETVDFGTPLFVETLPVATYYVAQKIMEQEAPLHKITSSHLQIEVPEEMQAADMQFVVLLPYHRGWKATADGKACEISRMFGGYMLVDVKGDEGTPPQSTTSTAPPEGGAQIRIDLEFTPPGMYAGWVISAVAGVVVMLLLCAWRRRTHHPSIVSDTDTAVN